MVGFEVIPVSVDRSTVVESDDGAAVEHTCTISKDRKKQQVTSDTTSIMFTYEVKWEVCACLKIVEMMLLALL